MELFFKKEECSMTLRDLTVLGCSSQQPTRTRNHGAYLVRWNEEGLLFDPGEGTQRQFIFANIAPPCVTRIFISHFHGDHCLGFGSMLMRLNLDKVTHPIHCYYPASGKVYFDRLRYGSIYHEMIHVIEHPVTHEGIVHDDGRFIIEARYLDHGIDNLGWRITEPDTRKFDKEKLRALKIEGPLVRTLEAQGSLEWNGSLITLDEVSHIRKGDSLAVVIDTVECDAAVELARGARLLLCESTYLEEHRDLADKHLHLTAKQAAGIAKQAGAKQLILTHFSARYQDLSDFGKEAKEIFPHTFVAEDLKCFSFPR
jgi:ribonuclease Z